MSQSQAQLVGNVVTGAVFAGVVTTTSANIGGGAVGINSTGINVVGVITATSINITGNVSIAGTLTYDDVTNVDSIGLVTARTGIQVLAGGINAVGVITATSFSGNGANLTGLTIPAGFTELDAALFS